MATKYFMAGGVNSNWSADTNWSTTSSAGPNNTTHAVAGDAVILDVGSPNCTIDAVSACATLTCTAYTNVLAWNNTLDTTGSVTFAATQATMTSDNPSTRFLRVSGTATLTAGGNTFPCKLVLQTAATYTLADAWLCTGALSISAGITFNGSTISAAGLAMTGACTGTTAITLTGGTWSGTSALKNNLTLAGNVSLSGASVAYNIGTLTYSSGTITVGTTPLNIADAVTLDTGGMTWGTVNYTASTKTLTMNSLFLATTLNITVGNPTFAGAFGFTVGTLGTSAPSSAQVITLTQGNTYTVTAALNVAGRQSFQWTLSSSDATLLTAFVLDPAATQSMAWVNATRIDSSAGQMIHSLNGVLNDPAHPTLNWDTPGTGAMWLFG